MTDKVKLILKTFVDFNEKEIDYVVAFFKPKTAKRNSILLHRGNICKEFYFINTGGIRTYFIDKNGYEKTRYVVWDNQFGTALKSFILQKPSIEFIETLDDSELLVISYNDFFLLNKELNNWKIFYQKILERAYSFQNKKIEALMTQTAKQRYEELLVKNPALTQRLSNKLLASYLDMREETLSRLKSQ
ncbi:Crp/Fnr family transcriptional regulator [Stygiobacter electus]|uniref:Crp/Fnr family transcriptional regulator n=1 Tax=Stygiobacter electus TaxID=3032292 RepID=A0AAE3NYE4_9BACT|nr:Crp/Fnr family transcriptional regulator [Stygiobacter electus]MDF1613241.1 Crp/Fnr family transcriptional regulator [Stygiobacter electus]